MISQISGSVERVQENTVTIGIAGISYDVNLPTVVIRNLGQKLGLNSSISFVTYHYHQTDQSKSIPILIGFSNQIEKDFFEKFITVSGVGPKAALRALSQPIPDIAEAIDRGELSYLKALPGIGEQRAKEIIAKLQGKMGKFGLMPGGQGLSKKNLDQKAPLSANSLKDECYDVLIQLQYKKDEARLMVDRAFSRQPNLSTVEEVLNEVYRQKKMVS